MSENKTQKNHAHLGSHTSRAPAASRPKPTRTCTRRAKENKQRCLGPRPRARAQEIPEKTKTSPRARAQGGPKKQNQSENKAKKNHTQLGSQTQRGAPAVSRPTPKPRTCIRPKRRTMRSSTRTRTAAGRAPSRGPHPRAQGEP
jgi:hypothetical protein